MSAVEGLQAGRWIYAEPPLEVGDVFAGTEILIARMDADGTTGFVMNKPMGRLLTDLVEFAQATQWPLYWGGPVAADQLFLWHCRPELIAGGLPCVHGFHLGGNMADALSALAAGQLERHELRLFVGYTGWEPGQLEEEFAAGFWRL